MAKVFDRLRDLMFGEYDPDYDDPDEDDYEEPDEDYEEPPAKRRTPLRDVNKNREPEYTSGRRTSSTTRTNPNVYSINTNVQMQVVVIQPTCYEDAQQICDQVKAKKPVVVNLEQVEYPIAQRILPQFASWPAIAVFVRFEHTTAFASTLACSSLSQPAAFTSKSAVAPSPSPAIFFARYSLTV